MADEKRVITALKRMREKAPQYVYSSEAEELLGMPGAMLSGSKTAPEGQTIRWNACIFNDKGAQIWHGDLNLTKRADELQALADQIGTIHVTPEQPFRFEGLKAGMASRGDDVVTFETRQSGTP